MDTTLVIEYSVLKYIYIPFKDLRIVISYLIIALHFISCSKEINSAEPNLYYHTLLYKFKKEVGVKGRQLFISKFEDSKDQLVNLKFFEVAKIDRAWKDFDIIVRLGFDTKESLKYYEESRIHGDINHLASKVIEDYCYFRFQSSNYKR